MQSNHECNPMHGSEVWLTPSLYQGVLLDGRPDGPSAQIFATALQREVAAGRAAASPDMRFSIGNKVNHPPPGTPANVVVCPLDLFETDGIDLLRSIPVFPFRPPAVGQPAKQTCVLLAARQLADEELWLDYKLRPEGPWEAWYSPVTKSG